MAAVPTCGKAVTVAGEYALNAQGFAWRISKRLRRFVFSISKSFLYPLKGGLGVVVIPQRSSHMEQAETPKYRSFHRCYRKPFAIRVGVYIERNSDEIRQEQSERGPHCLRESFICSNRMADNAVFELLDVAEGINYLHASYMIYGDLKGAGTVSWLSQTPLITPS